MSDFVTLVGRAGKNPTKKDVGPKGPVVTFTLAVKEFGFVDGQPKPTVWWDVDIWPNGPQDEVLSKVVSGMPVAVVGIPRIREVQGRTYRQVSAWELMIGEILRSAPKAAPAVEGEEW